MARIKAEEGEGRAKSEKPMQRTHTQSSRQKGKDTLATEVTTPAKPTPARETGISLKQRLNKQYSFKDDQVVKLFKLLQKSNKLKLPEARRPEDVGKVDDPKYCMYHRMIGHPTQNWYIFKDVLQALLTLKS